MKHARFYTDMPDAAMLLMSRQKHEDALRAMITRLSRLFTNEIRFMKLYTGIACIITIVALAVSCGTSLKVISDYDKAADFQRYKTFAIDTVVINEKISKSSISLISNAVKANLMEKGLTEIFSGADLKVRAAAILKDQQSVAANTDHDSYGSTHKPWDWEGSVGASRYTTYNLQNYKDGSLLIDIADAKTNKLVWQGIGNKGMNKPLKNPDKEIPALVASVMASFPPKGK
jgi:hypothetical protein